MSKQQSLVEERLVEALALRGQEGWERSPKGVLGSPDLCLPDTIPPVAVFVDGCFWHGCPQHYKPPRKRGGFWRIKVERNMVRDRGVGWPCLRCGMPTGLLPERGWIVVRTWEHEVVADPVRAADRVLKEISWQRSVLAKGLSRSSCGGCACSGTAGPT